MVNRRRSTRRSAFWECHYFRTYCSFPVLRIHTDQEGNSRVMPGWCLPSCPCRINSILEAFCLWVSALFSQHRCNAFGLCMDFRILWSSVEKREVDRQQISWLGLCAWWRFITSVWFLLELLYTCTTFLPYMLAWSGDPRKSMRSTLVTGSSDQAAPP